MMTQFTSCTTVGSFSSTFAEPDTSSLSPPPLTGTLPSLSGWPTSDALCACCHKPFLMAKRLRHRGGAV